MENPVSISPGAAPAVPSASRDKLVAAYARIRAATQQLCKPLAADDYQVQSEEWISPPKWHIAHMSWLLENFVLARFITDYTPFNEAFDYLFSSASYTQGHMLPRAQRGLLSRPTLAEIRDYREYVDEQMTNLVTSVAEYDWRELSSLVRLGLQHEQQHQELLLMDIKQNFFANPMKPAYRHDLRSPRGEQRPISWLLFGRGVYQIGHAGNGFAFDNESPRHEQLLPGYRLADRLITNSEYLDFIMDGGYDNPSLWLAEGWAMIKQQELTHPLYWQRGDSGWKQFTLGGLRKLNPAEPVCHVSYYEADAFARWAGKRLPLEAEIEIALQKKAVHGNFIDNGFLHPSPAGDTGQWFGDLWTWTASPYTAYPGFKPVAGAMDEYNGRLMSGRMVLKGGSCVTPPGHVRASYRNFFHPHERRAFSGIRLADDI